MNKISIRNVDPDVLWDAKIYAAQTKQTLGQVITDALERLISEEDEEMLEPEIYERELPEIDASHLPGKRG